MVVRAAVIAAARRARTEGGMLVLSRKRTEQIVIGSEIRITVVKLEGTQVRLGIEAPSDLVVLRAELADGSPAEREPRGPLSSARRGGRTRLARRNGVRKDQKAGPDGPGC